MKIRTLQPVIWLFIVIFAVSLACNFGSSEEPTQPPPEQKPTEVTQPDVSPPSVSTPESPAQQGGQMVSSLEDLEKAVIQIDTEGSFRDPAEGWKVNVGGGGTGFFIDPSGIAVTNNHVVSGAANLKVWVSGESSPRSARLLGVAECSDLAVIEVEGDGFNYLDWLGGDIKVGMDVYTAGFPISGAGVGYSLTKGIVSKSSGSVDWPVASVSNIIEHTAKVNPGNSGGPLVNESAQLVGVNFGFTSSLDQNYAVARDEAQAVIAQLRNGQDVDSLGINAVGVSGDLSGNQVTGIWVRSVKSGAPADRALIQPGDIIVELEGQVLSDGTMGDYCAIVRSHSMEDTMSVKVVRADTLEVMEGQVNGRELAVITTLSGGSDTGGDTGGSSAGAQGNPGATASGDYYFSTEFDSNENWLTLTMPETDDFRAVTDEGMLYMFVGPSKTGVYAFYDLMLENSEVRVDTVAQKVDGPNTNNISLVCRATDAGWYEFSMTSGGYWYIWLYEKGDGFTLLEKGATTAINLKNQANELTAVCSGRDLTFYINGIEVGSTTDRKFTGGGQVGVSIYSEYPDLGVDFDWFAATVP